MKKITTILAFVVALVLAVPANAQFKLGVEGGMNLSKASLSKDILNTSNRTGWFVGPKAQFTIPVIGLGIDGAVLYSQKYLELSNRGGDEFKKTLPSIEIPINLKYNIGFSSLVGIYISTGPQYGWNIGSKNLTWSDVSHGSLTESNFSWNVGAGINALNHLQIGVTYNIALGKTGEINNVGDAMSRAKIKNNTWQVRLAYLF